MNIKVDEELKKLIANSSKIENSLKQASIGLNKELTARTYAIVKKRTPVGIYNPIEINGRIYNGGRVGGTLRSSWQMSTSQTSKSITSKIYNNTEYAEYVEYGHRQQIGRFVPQIGARLKQPFVKGSYMLTKSLIEIKPQVDTVVQKYLDRIKI